MKAKKLISIFFLAVILCMITIFGVMADETYAPKIIRFDDEGTLNCTSMSAGKAENGVFKINMPTTSAYSATSAQPTFTLKADEQFKLSDYPYVKIKMRTNYTNTIQFYAINQNGIKYCEISNASAVKDGNWHNVEMYFDNEKMNQDTYYTANDGNKYKVRWNCSKTEDETGIVTAPFFQFKLLESSPNGDLFAEIEYIGFFHTENEMKEYDAEPSVVYVSGEQLKSKTTNSLTELTEDGAFRINSASGGTAGPVISNVFKDIYGNDVDLYEYPYAKVKFKSNYTKQVQLYIPGDKFNFHVQLSDISKGDDKWHNATLSYAAADKNSYNKTETTNSAGEKYTVNITSGGQEKPFPTEAGQIVFNDLRIQVKTRYEEGHYLDIAYIAFYKDKETMLNDTTFEDSIDAVNAVIDSVAETYFNCTLHQAIGEIAIENYIRETVEAANAGFAVAANAQGFTYGDTSCTVNLSISDGITTRTTSVNVAVDYLTPITLEMLGAQIRPIENDDVKADLRFGTKLAYNADEYTIVDCGTMLLPKNYRDTRYAFEKTSVGGYSNIGTALRPSQEIIEVNGKEVKYSYYRALNSVADNVNDIEGEDYKIFTAVITGIPCTEACNEYDTVVVARPYVTYQVGGKNFTYYGTAIERSVNQVKEAVENGNVDNDIAGRYDGDR